MGRAGTTRDFEAPLANLLVGTCELQVYSGHKVYLSVVLDAYSRVILQFIASLENNESVVLNMVDKVVENLQRPATIYFCQRGATKIKSTKSILSRSLCSRLLHLPHILAITSTHSLPAIWSLALQGVVLRHLLLMTSLRQ